MNLHLNRLKEKSKILKTRISNINFKKVRTAKMLMKKFALHVDTSKAWQPRHSAKGIVTCVILTYFMFDLSDPSV